MNPNAALATLRGLLHYHQRMMLGSRGCPVVCQDNRCKEADCLGGACPNALFLDCYAEALKEAIRCIEVVHKDELRDAL